MNVGGTSTFAYAHVKMRHGKTWAVGLFVCGERYRESPIIDNNPAQGKVGVCITAGSLVGVPIIKVGFKIAAYIPEVGALEQSRLPEVGVRTTSR